MWFVLVGGIILLVLYIWKLLIRHIINTLIIWALQIVTWVFQGAGWITGVLLFVFQTIDGRHPINNIRFGSIKEKETTETPETPVTPKPADMEKIDFDDPEQVAKFMRENKEKVKVVNNATGD